MESKKMLDFDRVELVEALSTFRTQFTLMLQAMTVLIIGNITVLGYAVANKNIFPIFIGSIISILGLYVSIFASKNMLPIIYTAIQMENKLNSDNSDFLMTTYISQTYSYKLVEKLKEISLQINQEDRMRLLRKLDVRGNRISIHRIICISSSLSQVAAGLLLLIYSNWKIL